LKARFKLTIELVPSSVWRSSLYQLLPRNVWNRIKREIYAREGRKCYICGTTEGRFSAHEFWEYDDETHAQKLAAIHHLCNLCHKIKHIGFWCHTTEGRAKLGQEGLNREDLVEHFCNTNNCNRAVFLKHDEEEAFDEWRERSEHQWKQDFGKYGRLIKN